MYLLSRTMKNGSTKFVGMSKDNTYTTCIQRSKALTFSDPVDAENFLETHRQYVDVGYTVTNDYDLFIQYNEKKSIVAESNGKYLSDKKYATNSDNTPFLTYDIECAVHFCSESSAKKYIISSTPKLARVNTFRLVKHEKGENKMTDERIQELMTQLRDGVDAITQVYNELTNASEYCKKSLDDVNWEIIDIQHAIELYDMNAYDSFKMTSKLKEKRKIRRLYKDFFEVIDRVEKDNNMYGFQTGKTASDLHALDNRTCTPRKMDGLFEDLDKKYKHNL